MTGWPARPSWAWTRSSWSGPGTARCRRSATRSPSRRHRRGTCCRRRAWTSTAPRSARGWTSHGEPTGEGASQGAQRPRSGSSPEANKWAGEPTGEGASQGAQRPTRRTKGSTVSRRGSEHRRAPARWLARRPPEERSDRRGERGSTVSASYPTSLGVSDADSIRLLGHDLAEDLMGKVGFGELAFWLIAGRRPAPGEVRVFEAVLVALADHGFTPTAIAARVT